MVGASREAHVGVVKSWTMCSAGVMSSRVRWWCLNFTVSENWAVLLDLDTLVWH